MSRGGRDTVTVAGDVALRLGGRDVTPTPAPDNAKFDWGAGPVSSSVGLEDEVVATRTFVVRQNALGNFHGAARSDIAGGGLEEDDGLLRNGVVQLFRVLAIIPANGHNLPANVSQPFAMQSEKAKNRSVPSFLAARTKRLSYVSKFG